jgi:hypothetical protein
MEQPRVIRSTVSKAPLAALLAFAAILGACGTPIPSPTAVSDVSPAPSVLAAAPSTLPAQPPYRVSCGPIPQVECEAEAERIFAAMAAQDPPRRVVWISMTSIDDYNMFFDDGTSIAVISN